MIEVNVLLEPLSSHSQVVGVEQGLVHWCKIFHSSLDRDESVSGIEGWLIVLLDSDWVPVLLAFWVDRLSYVKIFVNFSNDIVGDIISLSFELTQEDNFDVTLPGSVVRKVFWGGIAGQVDIVISKLL